MTKQKTVAIEDYDKMNAIVVSLRNSLSDERIRHDRLMAETTKRADENHAGAMAWRTEAQAHKDTIAKSRDDFAALKEHTHRLEMQLSRLEGYRDHVREVADSQRAPVTTTITEPSTAPRMQRNEAMRGSRTDVATNWPSRHMATTGGERERDWVNY